MSNTKKILLLLAIAVVIFLVVENINTNPFDLSGKIQPPQVPADKVMDTRTRQLEKLVGIIQNTVGFRKTMSWEDYEYKFRNFSEGELLTYGSLLVKGAGNFTPNDWIIWNALMLKLLKK